jgi:hypothetical protein
LCQRCHPGHYAQGTPHDLRQSAPQEQNRLGQTVAQGGPCSACHLSHRYAREIIPSPLDPDGYCITCHREAERQGASGASEVDWSRLLDSSGSEADLSISDIELDVS